MKKILTFLTLVLIATAMNGQSAEVSAKSIVEKYLTAIGGKAAIDKVSDVEMLMTASVMGQSMETRILLKKPNLSSTSVIMSGNTVQKVVFNGSVLKTSGMAGSKEYTEGPEFEGAKNNTVFCPERNYLTDDYKLTLKGTEKLNDKEVYVLEVQRGEIILTEFFDKESGLKVKTQSSVKTPQGEMQTVVEYQDYKVVDGIKQPHLLKQTIAGMNLEMVIKSIKINKGIDDAEFN